MTQFPILPPINTGDRIGTYRVIGTYPNAGYRAVDLADHTRVHVDVHSSVDWRERAIQLLRASSILGSLDHPGIARIHGRGVLPDRRPWVASELAEGVPLCDVFARRLLSVEEAVALVRDLAEIAAHAHARGILHGAIRPHRIVLRTGEKPFPIQLGGWGELEAGEIDGRIDVYAIGAIAYRGLTGKYPSGTPELVAGVPGPVGALLVKMLAIDPTSSASPPRRLTALEVLATSVRLCGDRALGSPRFSRPRWTPVPLPDSERVANVIDLAMHRRDRS